LERREKSDDRRKIERFTNPPVRSHFKQIHLFINFLTVFTFSTGVYHVAMGFYKGDSGSVVMGIFMGIMAFVVTTFMFRYSRALKDYLANESLGNLDRAMETQSGLWFVIAFMTIIYTIVYFVFAN
jgi:hypothetical protein